ncbi:MAG: hypothetical protein J0I44_06260 [Microbacterium sp.]|nr:hypothetical protein [Microbacterium sp.]
MRPLVALAFAVIGFVALFVCGLGIASLVLNQDPISAPGFGQLPGILGSIAAAAAFAGGLWASLSRPHPSFWGALWTTAATFLGYLIGVGVGALIEGADRATAAAAIGRLATTWFGAVIAAAALIAGWGGIALVRTRARRPRWPWERDDEEE